MNARLFFSSIAVAAVFLFSACTGLEREGSSNEPPPQQNQEQGQLPPQNLPSGFVDGGVSPPPVVEPPPPVQTRPLARTLTPEVLTWSRVSETGCFDFVIASSALNRVPMAVYETRTDANTRTLVFAERLESGWRRHSFPPVTDFNRSRPCHFLPKMIVDGTKIYVAYRGAADRFQLFVREGMEEGAEWRNYVSDLAGVGESNISIKKVGDYIKVIYRGANRYPQMICLSADRLFVSDGICTGEVHVDRLFEGSESYFYLLPWVAANTTLQTGTMALRFSDYEGGPIQSQIVSFRRAEDPGMQPVDLGGDQPAVAMGPTESQLNIVFTSGVTRNLTLCSFRSSGDRIGCEALEATGEYPSLHMASSGLTVVSYYNEGALKLAKKPANGEWGHQTVVYEKGEESGRRSIVRLGSFQGTLQTHIVYTMTNEHTRTTSLNYIRVP